MSTPVRHISVLRLLTLPAFGTLALFFAGQAIADWRYVEAQSTQPASVGKFLIGSDQTLWSSTSSGIARTGVDGRTTFTLPGSQIPGAYQPWELRLALPDGSIMLGDSALGLLRIDAQGNPGWRLPLANAWGLQSNEDGVTWVGYGPNLQRLAPDGRIMATSTPFATFAAPSRLAVDRTGNVIVGGDRQVAYVNRIGVTRWRKEVTDPVQDIVLARDDSFWLAGTDPVQAGSLVGPLTVRRLDVVTGDERWALNVPDLSLASVAAAPGDAGSLYLLGRRSGNEVDSVLLRVTSDGRIDWRRNLCQARPSDEVPMTVTDDGSVTVACRNRMQAQVLRFDRSGNPTGDALLPLVGPLQVQWRPDGSLLVAGYVAERFGRQAQVALDRDFHLIAPPVDIAVSNQRADVVAQHIADDGTTYIATEPDERDGSGRRLTRVAADGTRSWTLPLDERLGYIHPLMAGSGKACYVRWRGDSPGYEGIGYSIHCFADADGTPLWYRDYPSTTPYGSGTARILDNGNILLVVYFDNAFEIVRIDGSGNIIATTRHAGQVVLPAITGTGHVFAPIDLLRPTAALVHYDAEGRQVYSVAASTLQSNWLGFDTVPAADGSVAILGHLAGAPVRQQSVWLLAPDGSLRWHHDLGSEFINSALLRSADAVYVRQSGSEQLNDGIMPSRVTRIDVTDGAVRWQQRSIDHEFTATTGLPGQFALTPGGGKVLVMSSWLDRLRVQRYDAATGTRELDRYLPCNRACSQAYDMRVATNGATVAVQILADPQRGDVAIVSAWDSLATLLPDIRLDQPGIIGAWWAPYANGEGFVLDWLPSSRTLFMPWFTFSREGGNDPAGQRWYSIAGEVPANATRVELPIAEAVGGAFDDPQAVTRRVIGKATLNFTDCDNGTLQYAFDAPYNGGATGTITLSRLSPATQDCRLANGSSQTRAAAPANGFDARMSGSWYEEATSGQGLQFTVQPGGVFFAPWFTFDPKGAADDPDNQRWFSIQGSLANANDGMVELPIAQALGGAFDSVPTNNFSIVGKATLTMQSCERAKIDYRFDDNELAGAMRGKAGTLDLVKAGGCTP